VVAAAEGGHEQHRYRDDRDHDHNRELAAPGLAFCPGSPKAHSTPWGQGR